MKIFESVFEILPVNVRVLCWNIVNHHVLCLCFDNETNLFIVCSITIEHKSFTYQFSSLDYTDARDYYTINSISPKIETFMMDGEQEYALKLTDDNHEVCVEVANADMLEVKVVIHSGSQQD